jgi:hypothetical protein
MSAVVEFVSDVVGGVAEAVGDVVEGAVEIVEDVGSAIDDYVIQPILDDPLTAIATAAGAYYLGPMAVSQFGTTAAVGAGLGAAAGNFTAGMAQGEDFDEAVKGAAIAGLTVGATKGAFDYFGGEGASLDGYGGSEVGVDIDAFGNPIDAGAGTNSYVSGFEGATPGPAPDLAGTTTLGDFSFGDGYGGLEVGVDIDAFGNPIDAGAGTNSYVSGFEGATPGPAPASASAVAPDVSSGFDVNFGEGYGGAEVGVDIDAFGRPIDPMANPYANYGFEAPPSQYALDAGQGTGLKATPLDSGMPSQYSLSQTMPTDYSLVGPGSSTMMGSPGTSWLDKIPTVDQLTSLDYYGDLAGNALDYAIENPLTTAGGALLAYSALNQPEIPQGPPVRQPNESDEQFKTRLKLYEYRRQQTPVTDIADYGYGPQQRFFTPAEFVPIETAADGGLMGQAPGYYRYGRQPTGMAMGGRMINSPLAQYGQGGAHGRSDDVPAVLSDGEYVIDAETVALLGNGSVDAGANQLDRMREEIRRHKGRNLAQGKISSDARSPLSYLKG